RPASERAVRVTSSNVGCRSSRRAASAPVNPAAPNTAALGGFSGGTDRSRKLVGQRLDDPLANTGDLFVGQGPVASAEREPKGQRHVALPHALGVPVDVEHINA